MSDLELALELLKVKEARTAMVDPKKSGLSITVDGQRNDVSACLESAFVEHLAKLDAAAIDPLIDWSLNEIHHRLLHKSEEADAELSEFRQAIGWKPPQHDQEHDLKPEKKGSAREKS